MRIFLFLLILPSCIVSAQSHQSNWFMGTYLGMQFNGSNMSIIPALKSKMYAPYGSATYSNPNTGALMFYTNGGNVYSANHLQMPNGFYLNEESYATHCLILEIPGDKNRFYIFSSSTTTFTLYYAIVDMRLNGGLGDVTEKTKVLCTATDQQFTAVRRMYNEGYWLITHKTGSNEFYTFEIDKDGINPMPVKSVGGSRTENGSGYGKMISNSKGTEIAFAATSGDFTTVAFTELFTFDKACGKVEFKQSIFAHPMAVIETLAYPAFSPNDNLLYVTWIYNAGQALLLQYNLTLGDPNSTYIIIDQNHYNTGDMQLAPDGKIYMASAENSTVTSKISVIMNPNVLGQNCTFKDKIIDLGPAPPVQVQYFTEHFPEFVMDRSNEIIPSDKPRSVVSALCDHDAVTFTIDRDIYADSVLWDFGDGKSSRLISTTHVYDSVKRYAVKFTWYACTSSFDIFDTVEYLQRPKVELGNDTTLCPGETVKLIGPDIAEKYLWSTGDTTTFLFVKSPGTYILKAGAEGCWGEDEINIDYKPNLWLTLGDEYFICDKDKELVKLDAGEGFKQYLWSPTGDTTQWIIVGDLGNYFVVVNDFRGCSGKDGTMVKRRCSIELFFPNAFTPNNDGVNDSFVPKGTDVVSYHLKIYNQWGQLVFESEDLSKNWDGKMNNVIVSDGIYFYIASYTGYVNKKLKEFESHGNLTLLR